MGNATLENGKKRAIRHKTFKAFLQDHLADYLEAIVNHGCDAGFPWLTYTSDTVVLFDKYGDEIWELAQEESEAMGCKNVAEFIAGFRRDDMLTSLDTMKNLMVWFAAEAYARQIVEGKED